MWKPHDYIVLIIALTIFVFVAAVMAHILIANLSFSETKAKIIGGLVTALVSVLGVYVGSKLKGDE